MKNNSNKIDENQEPPEYAIKFANSVFVLGILSSFLLLIYAIFGMYNPIYVNYRLIIILTCGISIIMFYFGMRLDNDTKINVSFLIAITSISVYGFEIFLEFRPISTTRYQLAEEMGIPYDTRMLKEVIKDLHKTGIESYPNILPLKFANTNGLSTKNGRIYPLGGISNITTVFPNESGYFPIIETDEYGFNNPKELYKKNSLDISLVGDSFTEGYCVHPDETISAILRKSGFNTISLGKASDGPLLANATLKEYGKPLKPKIVLWLYCEENDLNDLKKSMNSSLLTKYLNYDGFSQNLISRQDEIDSLLINYFWKRWETEEQNIKNWPIKILKLYNIRSLIHKTRKNRVKVGHEKELRVFKNIIEDSNKMVLKWYSKFYFIYLPSINFYLIGDEDQYRENIIRMVTELDIPLIDIHEEVFSLHPDPLSIFPFRESRHYNAEGYRLVAEAIGKKLSEDGISSSNINN